MGIQKVSDSDILYAYNNFSTKDAISYLGIAQSTYYKRLEKLGVERNKYIIKATDEEVIKAVKESESIHSAAKKLNMLPSSLTKRMVKLNIQIEKEKDYRKYKVNDDSFSKLNAETAYWLGFIAADGSVVGDTLRFVLNKRDEETLQRFLNFCKSDYKINYHTSYYIDGDGVKHEFDAVNLKITSKKIVRDLAKYGIIQNKKNMDIPFIDYIPEKYKLDFIIGLFDGDGSVTPESYSITISTNKANLNEIAMLLSTLGINYYTSDRGSVNVIYISNMTNYNKFKTMYLDREYDTMARKRFKFLSK